MQPSGLELHQPVAGADIRKAVSTFLRDAQHAERPQIAVLVLLVSVI